MLLSYCVRKDRTVFTFKTQFSARLFILALSFKQEILFMVKAIHKYMTDQFKSREMRVCPVNLSLYYVSQYERNNKVVCGLRQDLDQ